jgi:hypothetical protein
VTVLTVQALGSAHPSFRGERFNLLPIAVQRRMASRVIDWGMMHGLDELRRRRPGRIIRGMGDLSQADQQTVADSVASALSPILGSTLKSTTADLSAQAAAVMGPVIEQKLAAYGPVFAIIMGLVTATLTLAGMALFGGYLLKKLR